MVEKIPDPDLTEVPIGPFLKTGAFNIGRSLEMP